MKKPAIDYPVEHHDYQRTQEAGKTIIFVLTIVLLAVAGFGAAVWLVMP